MDYSKPQEIIGQLVTAGAAKANLASGDLLIRGGLSGAFLGFATTLAYTANIQTQKGIFGALVFPAGFVMIVLLGLELVTGNFAVVPLAVMQGRVPASRMWRNWSLVFLGNLLGCLLYAVLFSIATPHDGPMATQIVSIAEAKTSGYATMGSDGLLIAFVKAMLCNWMVTLGVVMAFTSQSTAGKIAAMWLPIVTFFAQGFEHSVVNMFVIPAGILFGAHISFSDWWLWNQIPVTAGNVVSGFLFTGLALYLTYRPAGGQRVAAPVPVTGSALPLAES